MVKGEKFGHRGGHSTDGGGWQQIGPITDDRSRQQENLQTLNVIDLERRHSESRSALIIQAMINNPNASTSVLSSEPLEHIKESTQYPNIVNLPRSPTLEVLCRSTLLSNSIRILFPAEPDVRLTSSA